jgi:hypothetical protein
MGHPAMLLRPCQLLNWTDRTKARPASHSYLNQGEPLVVAFILSLCGGLIYAAVWLIRLLG